MSKNILWGVGTAVFATVAMMGITIKDNRQFAKEEMLEINSKIYEIQLNRNSPVAQYVHKNNTNEKLEAWRKERIAEKEAWMKQPFYKQLHAPPIATFVDLHQEL